MQVPCISLQLRFVSLHVYVQVSFKQMLITVNTVDPMYLTWTGIHGAFLSQRSPTTAGTDNNSQLVCMCHMSGVRFSCEASIMPCAVKA